VQLAFFQKAPKRAQVLIGLHNLEGSGYYTRALRERGFMKVKTIPHIMAGLLDTKPGQA
jgi:hypothetical protein